MIGQPIKKGGKAKKVALTSRYGPGKAAVVDGVPNKNYQKVKRRVVQKHKQDEEEGVAVDLADGQIFDTELPVE